MINLKTGISSRRPSAQSALFVAAYLCAASLVTWSAASAKRSMAVPALAALDGIRIPASTSPADSSHTTNTTDLGRDLVRKGGSAATVAPAISVEVTEPIIDEIRYFNGRAIRPVKTLWMTVTGYSPDERSCGEWADGITASNKSVWTNAMQLVAADTRILPFGSLLTIEGYANDQVVPVEDRGGAIKGMRLDLLYPTHEEALQWGVKRMPVTVWEYVDG